MANTFFGLTIASSGLSASNIAINTTAHNISNVNTKGYSKQVTNQTAADAIRVFTTYGTVGTGVSVQSIDQLRNEYYDTKYWNNNANKGQYSTLEKYTALVEDYLDEFNLDGFTKEYQNFFNAVNTLTTNPTDEVARNQFINYAQSIAKYFNTLSANFQNVQKSANDEIKTTVDSINTIAKQITSLNKQINTIQVNGGEANDLKDARALLVDKLSEYVGTSVRETPIGNGATEYCVFINGQELVQGYDYNELECTAREVGNRRNASDADGLYDIAWKSGMDFDLYGSSLRGSLRAAVDIRDGCNNGYEVLGLKNADGEFLKDDKGYPVDVQDLSEADYEKYAAMGYEKSLTTYMAPYHNSDYKGMPYYQTQINDYINAFCNDINEVIKKGDLGGEEVQDFFVSKYGTDYLCASNIAVNENIIRDTSLLPYSFDRSQGEANVDMAEELFALKNKTTINNGTYLEYLSSMVAVVAIESSKAINFSKNYENIQATISNQRLSVCGVDEDEEAVDLVKFQNAYGLSSKVVSVMQQIYSKLIEETGV